MSFLPIDSLNPHALHPLHLGMTFVDDALPITETNHP